MSSRYPEHDKMRLIKDESQTIGGFLDWLQSEKQFEICERVERRFDDELVPIQLNIERLLADHFEIDLDVINDEKDAMFAELRGERPE